MLMTSVLTRDLLDRQLDLLGYVKRKPGNFYIIATHEPRPNVNVTLGVVDQSFVVRTNDDNPETKDVRDEVFTNVNLAIAKYNDLCA